MSGLPNAAAMAAEKRNLFIFRLAIGLQSCILAKVAFLLLSYNTLLDFFDVGGKA